MMMVSGGVLFGESQLNARRQYKRIDNDETIESTTRVSRPPPTGGLAHFLFGFMYDEDEIDDDDDDLLYRSTIEATTPIWKNRLNVALFVQLVLITAADAVPVTLMTRLSDEFDTGFAAQATAAAVLGTSVGKFINGPVGDIVGARRTCVVYSILLAMALLQLAVATSPGAARWACFGVEFAYSVQWPCTVILLATHYRGDEHGMYEGGIYVTSLAARLGLLIGIPVSSFLLRYLSSWRWVAVLGAWTALISSSVTYLFVTDAPNYTNQPQNPMDPTLLQKWFPDSFRRQSPWTLGRVLRLVPFVIQTNVLPSMKHVLKSGTFWILALAHTGSSMVVTSVRLLGTYYYDTSNATLSEARASELAVFLSIGTVLGLVIAGNLFASRPERERKWLVTRLYAMTILSCYLLAFLAISVWRNFVNTPELITTFQVMASIVAGAGIAVQMCHIPSLVGATFGCDKGLFSAYTDGVAYGLASLVWRIVGDAVQHGNADGWAYGWAAVALLVLLSAILMVEFMEHYFCRHGHVGGNYETIIVA